MKNEPRRRVETIFHASRTRDAVAREELATLRAAFDGSDPGEQGRALLHEIEALLEQTPSSTGDG